MIERLWDQPKIRRRPFVLKLMVPSLLSALATWLILGPLKMMGVDNPLLICFLAVFFSACFGGWRSALVATLVCTAAAICFIFPLHDRRPAFYLSIMLFLAEGLMLTCLFCQIEEINERLQCSEARFRGMIEKNAEGFLLTDADGMIKYVAPAAAALLTLNIGDLKNTQLADLIHPEERRSFGLQWFKLRDAYGEKFTFKQRLKTDNDHWLWVEGTATNLLQDPQVQALIFHYRDISERVNTERQQEDFVHMASHELKTPITALKGYAQLMQMHHRKEGREKDRSVLDRMDLQLNKMLNLIDSMLDMTRIKTGELSYHLAAFDITACINEVVESIQTTTPGHQLIFESEDLPLVYGDRDKIGQVINNLINNAVKYSPNGKKVILKASVTGSNIYVRIKDDGIGIPKNRQKKIFERFYRVDTLPKGRFDGLGLGLYISMEIIKKHGGLMGVESEENDGSEFWFGLPIKN